MLPAYKTQNKRAKVRLNLANGYADLKREGLPPLRCGLRDLSEGGFQCVAREADADPTAFTAWKIFLSSSQKQALAGVVLTLEPYLKDMPLRAEIRFQKIRPQGELVFGM